MEWNSEKVKVLLDLNIQFFIVTFVQLSFSLHTECSYLFYSIFYEPREFYSSVTQLNESDKGGVAIAMGWKVMKIDVINQIVTLEDGYEIKYNKCLIATGRFC